MTRFLSLYWRKLRSVKAGTGLLVLGLALGLSACQVGESPGQPPASVSTETASAPLTSTAAPVPTSTPEPGRVIWFAPQEANPAYQETLQPLLSELASLSGLVLDLREELSEADLTPQVRLVVAVPPAAGLADLAAAHPQVQFLAIEIPELAPAPNLSRLAPNGPRPDQQGFVAGYLAAVITSDWRVGVVSLSGDPAGQAARLGFVNGAIFFCGLCRPYFPPYIQYPVTLDLTPGAGEAEQQAVAQNLVQNGVKTVYVYPGIPEAGLLAALSQAGVQWIGGRTAPAGFDAQWVTGVAVDYAGPLRQVWPQLLSGQGGLSLELPLQLVNPASERFSPGRQHLVEKMIADLVAGFIDTGVNPLTGQPR